jgi:hypothetical protein
MTEALNNKVQTNAAKPAWWQVALGCTTYLDPEEHDPISETNVDPKKHSQVAEMAGACCKRQQYA